MTEKTYSIHEVFAMQAAERRQERERIAAAKGMTVAELDIAEAELESAIWRERDRQAKERARAKRAAQRVADGIKTPPSGPLRLQSILVWECEDCKTLQHVPCASPLLQCKECEGYFNEENAAGDNSNKCPDCEKRGRKAGAYSCAECEKGPVEEVEAFLCPIGADTCIPLEDEDSVAVHLNDEHEGEFPGEWFDADGGLILNGEPRTAPASGSVACADCGAIIPGEESIGSEGRDYCFACAGVL